MNTASLISALIILIAAASTALATSTQNNSNSHGNSGAVVATPTVSQNPIMLDLTEKGSSGFINDAKYLQGTIFPTGTGYYEPFLHLQQKGIEQGFNTSADGVLDNKAGIWTKDLLANIIPTITVNGEDYREIRLDINEKNNETGRYLSLDSLEIYLEDFPGIDSKAGLTNLKYSMDATVDNYVKLDYTLASGSGWDDMSVLLPESIFDDTSTNTTNRYFYLYSRFGEHFSSDAGFEEWAADPPAPVPEPSTLMLLGAGLIGMGFLRRRVNK